MNELEDLRENVEKIAILSELFDNMRNQKITDQEDLEEIKLKMVYAKEQIISLCLDNKKILTKLEKKEAP